MDISWLVTHYIAVCFGAAVGYLIACLCRSAAR